MPSSAPSMLIVASTLIMFVLGALHLLLVYRGAFYPRERELESRMKVVSPVISRETTMWKAAIGFHASHCVGAMLFSLVYGYLALEPTQLLFKSPFLLGLGLIYLCVVSVLCRLYWLRAPFWGMSLAALLFASALITRLQIT